MNVYVVNVIYKEPFSRSNPDVDMIGIWSTYAKAYRAADMWYSDLHEDERDCHQMDITKVEVDSDIFMDI